MAPPDWQEWEGHDDDEEADWRRHGQQWSASSWANGGVARRFAHAKVPRSHNLAQQFCESGLPEKPTTIMIRNIPNRYSQKELVRELEALGFAQTFDFFYAPIDTGTQGNVGYAFVNFVNSSWADRCFEVLNGYSFRKHQQRQRAKIASVSVAHLQGLEANLRHYENTAVNVRSRCKRPGGPLILPGGHGPIEQAC